MENQEFELTAISAKKRPTFLSVLCILTWVGCAISLYSSLNQILGPSPRENMMKMATQADKLDGAAKEMIESSVDFFSANLELLEKWTLPTGIIGFLCTGLCAFGAFYMWKLKKIGFPIYAVGEIIPLLIGLFMYFNLHFTGSSMMNMIMKGGTLFNLIIGAAFVIMYSVNLKHLKSETE